MTQYVLVPYPLPGHINPTLQFAHRLICTGARVTILTTIYGNRLMTKSPAVDGLFYVSFSDGYDEGAKPSGDVSLVTVSQKKHGGAALAKLMHALADEGRRVACVVYTQGLTWAADVARTLRTPSALLWLQPATVFTAYHFGFHDYADQIADCLQKGPSSSVKLPGLPLLTSRELPMFVLPFDPHSNIDPAFRASMHVVYREQFETLDIEEKPIVFLNTFDEAEMEAIRAVDKLSPLGVGPLVPLSLLDGQDRSGVSDRVELHKTSRNYIEWMDSKPASSVVYVSFGSIADLNIKQMVEILNGLLESGHPFLWVIRPTGEGTKSDDEMEFWKRASGAEEMKEAMVVPWCSQVEVLSHPSLGCFASHCGWNSTLESLVAGVPMVCLPQWIDQMTNAKMIEDMWRVGVRAKANGEGIVEGEELKRCLDLVMGGEGEGEIRKNAVRWRDLARQAMGEGGSSDRNIRAFVEGIGLGKKVS